MRRQGQSKEGRESIKHQRVQKPIQIQLLQSEIPLTVEHKEKAKKHIEHKIILLNHQIKCYFFVILANNPNIKNSELQNLQNLFTEADLNLKNSQSSVKEGFKNVQKLIKKIEIRSQMPFAGKDLVVQISQYLESLQRKCGQKNFLRLSKRLHFNYGSYETSKTMHKFKDITDLTQSLKELNIDMKFDIKDQVHKYLTQPHRFLVQFSGARSINETLIHKDTCLKQFSIDLEDHFTIVKQLEGNKRIGVLGEKGYAGTVKIKKCQCGYDNFFLGWTGCQFCSHYQIDIPYSGTKYSPFMILQQVKPQYNKTYRMELKAKFTAIKNYQTPVQIQENISFIGSRAVQCKDHHQCSCIALAEFALSAQQVRQQIEYYNKIIQSQDSFIKQLNLKKELPTKDTPEADETPQQTPTQKNQSDNQQNLSEHNSSEDSENSDQSESRQSQDDMDNEHILASFKLGDSTLTKMTLEEAASMIHQHLSHNHSIPIQFSEKKMVRIERPFSTQVGFQGTGRISGILQCSADAHYSEQYEYGRDVEYQGVVPCKICYENCRYCQTNTNDQKYRGQMRIQVNGTYKGVVSFQETRNWSKYENYNEFVKTNGIFKKNMIVDYKKQDEAICKKDDDIGKGHHSCSSCQLWSVFVISLKRLLQRKQRLKHTIQDNKQILLAYLNKKQ